MRETLGGGTKLWGMGSGRWNQTVGNGESGSGWEIPDASGF